MVKEFIFQRLDKEKKPIETAGRLETLHDFRGRTQICVTVSGQIPDSEESEKESTQSLHQGQDTRYTNAFLASLSQRIVGILFRATRKEEHTVFESGHTGMDHNPSRESVRQHKVKDLKDVMRGVPEKGRTSLQSSDGK